MRLPKLLSLLVCALSAWAAGGPTQAAVAHVAVAANFAEPMQAMAAMLEKDTGHTLRITVGATGKLYAQIRHGAPFDVLLAANVEVPQALERDGLARPDSRFTYARGRLVLWSAKINRVDPSGDVLHRADLGKVAFANPKVAPYGEAAVQAMERLGLGKALAPRLVQGESIGQTYGFVHSGNADVGFVALSQVVDGGKLKSGSMWLLPQTLHEPIAQDAVLLQRGAHNAAAQALLQLLRSDKGRALIRAYGYDI